MNRNVIDGNFDIEIIKDSAILVYNNTIANDKPSEQIEGVGKRKKIEIPDDYQMIDLNEEYVIPWLINAYALYRRGGQNSPINS